MNKTVYVKVTFVSVGVSKKSEKRFARLAGVELARQYTDNSVGRPVYDAFLTSKILDVWSDEQLLDLARDNVTVALDVANFKDDNSGDWVNCPVSLSVVSDFKI